jgi:hypothetical protein
MTETASTTQVRTALGDKYGSGTVPIDFTWRECVGFKGLQHCRALAEGGVGSVCTDAGLQFQREAVCV